MSKRCHGNDDVTEKWLSPPGKYSLFSRTLSTRIIFISDTVIIKVNSQVTKKSKSILLQVEKWLEVNTDWTTFIRRNKCANFVQLTADFILKTCVLTTQQDSTDKLTYPWIHMFVNLDSKQKIDGYSKAFYVRKLRSFLSRHCRHEILRP